MNGTDQLVTIFCEMDDFCKELNQYTQQKLLPAPAVSAGHRGPRCKLALSEIMTIMVMFHQIRFRDFKTFYTGFVLRLWQPDFPDLPCYERFVELIKRTLFPMALFTRIKSGKRTGIYYIDSTCLPVCHLKRSKQHKVFDEVAQYGRTSVGWFFGLKLHLVTNDKGELLAFKITQGNRSDSTEANSLLSHWRDWLLAIKDISAKNSSMICWLRG